MSFTSGPLAAQAQQVLFEDIQSRPQNTRLAYDKKLEEFLQFCRAIYPKEQYSLAPEIVTEVKLFDFLYYQSRRPQRARGKRKKIDDDEKLCFNSEEYNFYKNNPASIAEVPIGYSSLNHYYSGIIDLHQQQVDHNLNACTKEQLRSNRVLKLLNNVKKRKKALAEKNFEEKLNSEFAPYVSVSSIPQIEAALFERYSMATVKCISSLRDRFCFLMTFSGILRGESLFNCDLSDLCDVIHESPSSGIAVHILVMRIAQGKTNGLKTLYGRVMRHRDVNQCAVGALALYLFARFHHGMETMNFSSNAHWFRTKLLIDPTKDNKEVAVKDQNYARAMKKVCNQLNIPSQHWIHFGRTVGSIKAELEELDGYNINDLGNWSVDTRRDVYSAKLPMKAMRVMAGHSESKYSVHLPRSSPIPPTKLQKMIFPFVDEQLSSLTTKNPTALAFIGLLVRLRIVLLQDVATMLIAGRNHIIFSHTNIFRCPEFEAFTTVVKNYLEDVKDPVDQSIECALPGVMQKLSGLENRISGQIAGIQTSITSLNNTCLTRRHLQDVFDQIGQINVLEDTKRKLHDDGDDTHQPMPQSELGHYPYQYHKSCRSIWDEWHGLNSFCNLSLPIGGLAQLEATYKNTWRKKFDGKTAKYFSRLKKIVSYIKELSELKEAEEIIEQIDQELGSKQISTVPTIELYLKKKISEA